MQRHISYPVSFSRVFVIYKHVYMIVCKLQCKYANIVVMGPLQLVSHLEQKRLAGEQETYLDMTKKENYHFRWCKLHWSYWSWKMGPFQLVSHVVQKHLADEQETHWDKTNKELTSPEMVILFIFFFCIVPVRFLLTSKVYLYHVTEELKRAHFKISKTSEGVCYWSRRFILWN